MTAKRATAFTLRASEAKSSFADDRIFIEKYIEEPRHIEIQVLGDAHGNIVYLGERECSIQRRHQKVIEEAPSPFLDARHRARAMGAAGGGAGARRRLRSAGTVEFIVDRAAQFLFPRNEHAAAGRASRDRTGHRARSRRADAARRRRRKAAVQPRRLRLDGWAIEARIYAEDPTRDFLPSTGRLIRYLPPQGDGSAARRRGLRRHRNQRLLRPDDRQARRPRRRSRHRRRPAARRPRRVLHFRLAAQRAVSGGGRREETGFAPGYCRPTLSPRSFQGGLRRRPGLSRPIGSSCLPRHSPESGSASMKAQSRASSPARAA